MRLMEVEVMVMVMVMVVVVHTIMMGGSPRCYQQRLWRCPQGKPCACTAGGTR